MLCSTIALGQDRAHRLPAEPIITVNGQGEIDVKPDQAVVRLGATAQEKDAADAQADVNKVIQKAINQIKSLGIKENEIRTDQISLRPVYSPEDNRGEFPRPPVKIIGYQASNVLKITIDDLNQIGPVIDAGVAAGANDIQGVDFGLTDDTAATLNALTRATQQAAAKAHAIANALNVELGPVIEVSEGGVQRIMPMSIGRGMMAAAAAPSTPIEAGQIKINAQVTIAYRIQPHGP
ncbi:MAG TPA: SIMPL domain-containing protein [Tepidisphaeraceae bacterium]|nr:SIMPL domain-containing protein [Tepidisphaeraceae bacterium]